MTKQPWQYTNGKKTKSGRSTWKRPDGVAVHTDTMGTFVVMTAAGMLVKYQPGGTTVRRFGTNAQAQQFADETL